LRRRPGAGWIDRPPLRVDMATIADDSAALHLEGHGFD
jgi:hypothetical protein